MRLFILNIVWLSVFISNQVLAKSQFTMPPAELFSDLSVSFKQEEKVQNNTEANNRVDEIMQLSIKSSKPNYKIGEYLSLEIKTNKDCYLTVIDIGSSGNAYILYPNSYQKNNFIKARESLSIPNQHFDIQVGEPAGSENIWAICRTDNKPAISQGYKFKKNVFISLGEISTPTQLSGVSSEFLESKETRKNITIKISQ